MKEETKAVEAGALSGTNGVNDEVMSIADIRRQYEGEWVLVRITQFNEHRDPTHGRIIAHSVDRDEVHRAVPPRPAPPAPSDGPYYVFLAQTLLTSGPDFDKAVHEFMDALKARWEAERRGMA